MLLLKSTACQPFIVRYITPFRYEYGGKVWGNINVICMADDARHYDAWGVFFY